MENSLENSNWTLIHTEMRHDDGDFMEPCHTEYDDDDDDDDDFLRDILQQPELSCESHPPPILHNNSTDDTDSTWPHSNSPRTFILSFDNSTIIPATPQQPPPYLRLGAGITTTTSSSKSKSTCSPAALSSKKRALDSSGNNTNNDYQNLEAPKPSRATSSQGSGKKSRNDSQTMDHIMAERKRRQQLTERFIALSATIPALKKTDKASILGEAIKYVKQLQERVTELEKRSNNMQRGAPYEEAMILLVSKQDGVSGSSDGDQDQDEWYSNKPCSGNLVLPDVEARVMEKEVLVEIHCEKAYGIELRILEQLENLHLSVTASSVLPFGTCTLGITIIAQMSEGYRMTVNDLVTNLRQVLLMNNEATYY